MRGLDFTSVWATPSTGAPFRVAGERPFLNRCGCRPIETIARPNRCKTQGGFQNRWRPYDPIRNCCDIANANVLCIERFCCTDCPKKCQESGFECAFSFWDLNTGLQRLKYHLGLSTHY